MDSTDFWASVDRIIEEDFKPEGLSELDSYAEHFINGRLVYQRFSPQEQYGCSAGGPTNVIATLLAGAKARANKENSQQLSDFQKERKCGAAQEIAIECWAKKTGVWTDFIDEQLPKHLGTQIAEGGEAIVYDHGSTLIKSIGLDYFIQPIFALDRISLHNTYFPETKLFVLGFGRNSQNEFRIIVEQPFIEGTSVSDSEIAEYMKLMGFELKNPNNWTYATPDIYLSDMHDENVIRSTISNTIFVVDCDIRINTPELKQGGRRQLTTDIYFH